MRYTTSVQNKINQLKNEIKKVAKLNEDMKICKQILPDRYPWLDEDINYSFSAKSMDEVKDILKKFAKEGIMLDEFQNSNPAQPIWWLKNNKTGTKIRISPYWASEKTEGVTCRLIQIGEETYTRPKYKLVCDDKESEYTPEMNYLPASKGGRIKPRDSAPNARI